MADIDVIAVSFIPLGLIVAGIFVFWITSASYQPNAPRAYSATLGLQFLGGVLLVSGIIGGVATTTLFLAVLAIPITILILIVFIRRFYKAEQQSLLWGLLTAAERGIPLNVAAQAFAEERNDILGRRAGQLADYLEAGVPLGLSLRRSGFHVDPGVSLAADVGSLTGTLGPALREVLDRSNVLDAVTIPTASRFVYLGVTVVNTLIVQTFLMLKIIPVLQKVHHDFGMELPEPTKNLMDSSRLGSSESYLWLAFVAVGVLGLALGVGAMLGSLRSVPIVRRLWWRVDCALAMRWLGTGVCQGRPILDMLRLLAGYYPHAGMRWALDRAALGVEQGAHWCDCLVRARLIRKADSAVFKAAERAGNLPWALSEMSDSAVRRWAYKLQVWMSFLFPFVLIMLSCGVLAVLLGIFTPLVSLILGLQ